MGSYLSAPVTDLILTGDAIANTLLEFMNQSQGSQITNLATFPGTSTTATIDFTKLKTLLQSPQNQQLLVSSLAQGAQNLFQGVDPKNIEQVNTLYRQWIQVVSSKIPQILEKCSVFKNTSVSVVLTGAIRSTQGVTIPINQENLESMRRVFNLCLNELYLETENADLRGVSQELEAILIRRTPSIGIGYWIVVILLIVFLPLGSVVYLQTDPTLRKIFIWIYGFLLLAGLVLMGLYIFYTRTSMANFSNSSGLSTCQNVTQETGVAPRVYNSFEDAALACFNDSGCAGYDWIWSSNGPTTTFYSEIKPPCNPTRNPFLHSSSVLQPPDVSSGTGTPMSTPATYDVWIDTSSGNVWIASFNTVLQKAVWTSPSFNLNNQAYFNAGIGRFPLNVVKIETVPPQNIPANTLIVDTRYYNILPMYYSAAGGAFDLGTARPVYVNVGGVQINLSTLADLSWSGIKIKARNNLYFEIGFPLLAIGLIGVLSTIVTFSFSKEKQSE